MNGWISEMLNGAVVQVPTTLIHSFSVTKAYPWNTRHTPGIYLGVRNDHCIHTFTHLFEPQDEQPVYPLVRFCGMEETKEGRGNQQTQGYNAKVYTNNNLSSVLNQRLWSCWVDKLLTVSLCCNPTPSVFSHVRKKIQYC